MKTRIFFSLVILAIFVKPLFAEDIDRLVINDRYVMEMKNGNIVVSDRGREDFVFTLSNQQDGEPGDRKHAGPQQLPVALEFDGGMFMYTNVWAEQDLFVSASTYGYNKNLRKELTMGKSDFRGQKANQARLFVGANLNILSLYDEKIFCLREQRDEGLEPIEARIQLDPNAGKGIWAWPRDVSH